MLKQDEILWCYCDQCKTDMLICPRCANNCCSGTYGPADLNDPNGYGTIDSHCNICPDVYEIAISNNWQAPPGHTKYTYKEAIQIAENNRKNNKYNTK